MATDPNKVLRDAVVEAQRILAQHLEPRGPSCERTISKLLGLLGGAAVLDALVDTAAAGQPTSGGEPWP